MKSVPSGSRRLPRAVLDTNVLVSAHISPNGAPAQILRLWRKGAFTLVRSPRLLRELESAPAGPELRGRVDESAAFLVALARAAGADVIVSGDRHLLELADLQPPALSPRQLLERQRRAPPKSSSISSGSSSAGAGASRAARGSAAR